MRKILIKPARTLGRLLESRRSVSSERPTESEGSDWIIGVARATVDCAVAAAAGVDELGLGQRLQPAATVSSASHIVYRRGL